MDGSKCILQLRGVRPFLSKKYDVTKHKNYKLLEDFDKKNAFDVEEYIKTKGKIKLRKIRLFVNCENLLTCPLGRLICLIYKEVGNMLMNEVRMKTDLTRKAIEYYEEKGFITPKREENNYRVYSENDVDIFEENINIQKIRMHN